MAAKTGSSGMMSNLCPTRIASVILERLRLSDFWIKVALGVNVTGMLKPKIKPRQPRMSGRRKSKLKSNCRNVKKRLS